MAVLIDPSAALASGGAAAEGERLMLVGTNAGFYALLVFIFAYVLVMVEEQIHLSKSKPVLVAAGLIWGVIFMSYASEGISHVAQQAVRHNLLEYAELFLFLLVAMTYINSMTDRQVFDALRAWLVRSGFSYRQLFWLTGALAFVISPIADNLTTALIMCAVVLAVGRDKPIFVSLSCINIVVAANAGGAFSPFGDITTLMVWQKGVIPFADFFALFIPSLLNWGVPAYIMSLKVPKEKPAATNEEVKILRGGIVIVVLFLLTIATAVAGHNYLHMPPVMGMMLGLGYLKIFAFYLQVSHRQGDKTGEHGANAGAIGTPGAHTHQLSGETFDIFQKVSLAEWDTLLFFYGVVLCVGGLGTIGYLDIVSQAMYHDWGATPANIAVGFLSAIVDNIPVMFAVLTMMPDMSEGQWLLVTLTAGVGGSMLSIGSAAGVALMGQARGIYTFASHLKWTPVIALGYFVSIGAHFLINGASFDRVIEHLAK
ncbi:putative citrate transporter [Magnetofaba australis IT-1]|uniref:Putative citrate transporter n=2 Tax=Magnetofaba TaxID=1472292 RepID=A0A1Y2K5I4_9PROT|nr:putative citrate transporter [Magnetofaba australis IT-1]